MQKNEFFTSHQEKADLITFIGFKEYLVTNFVRDNLKFDPSNIYIFTSSKSPLVGIRQEAPLNEVILNKLKDMVHSANEEIKIKENRTDNLWDIRYYYRKLKGLPDSNYVVNISSGPGVYSSASMLWALETNNKIAYSVEYRKNGVLDSITFRNLNMRPFGFYNFRSDNLHRYIITALEAGMATTTNIQAYLWKHMKYETSLRNIQIHVRELSNSGVIEIAGTKPYVISFSSDFQKLGYRSSDYPEW